mgnify:FL=1
MGKNILRLSPSGSSSWLKCTAAPAFLVSLQDELPDEDDSVYAAEGTLAHDNAAECLLLGFDDDLFGKNTDMKDHVQGYCDYIDSKRTDGDVMLIEEKLQPWYLAKEKAYSEKEIVHVTHGYSDCSIYSNSKLTVIDLKYGMGVSVQGEGNTQMAIYAMSLIFKLMKRGFKFDDDAEVELCIYQPRVIGEKAAREWKLSLKELRDFASSIYDTAQLILSGGETEFAPGETACRWCDAKALCSAYAGYVLEESLPEETSAALSTEFKLMLPDIKTLPKEDLVRLMEMTKQLTDYLAAVKKHLFFLVNDGDTSLGYKMVTGLGNRTWADPAAAEKYLRAKFKKDEILVPKLITAPQAEKLLKKTKPSTVTIKKFDSLVTRPAGKPTLVPMSDPRPADLSDLEKEFEGIGEDESVLPTSLAGK